MKLSTQEEYGLRCMVAIASKGAGASMTAVEFAEQEGFSLPNTVKVLGALRRGGYLQSTRGQAGGYRLAREAREIQIDRLLYTLGGKLLGDDFCVRHRGSLPTCRHTENCQVKPVWVQIQSAIDAALAGMTLEDLCGPVSSDQLTVLQ